MFCAFDEFMTASVSRVCVAGFEPKCLNFLLSRRQEKDLRESALYP